MSKKLIAGAGVVASFAIALAPLATFAEVGRAGWTSDQHTDRFLITVEPACAFGSANTDLTIAGVTHNATTAATGTDNGTATWTANVDASNDASAANSNTSNILNKGRTLDKDGGTAYEQTDRAAYSIYGGTEKAGFATTTLTVICNQENGYEITAVMSNLSDGDVTSPTYINANASYSAGQSGYAIDSVVADTHATGTVQGTFGTAKSAPTTESAGLIVQASDVSYVDTTTATNSGDKYTITYGIGVAPTQKATTYKGNVTYKLYQRIDSGA